MKQSLIQKGAIVVGVLLLFIGFIQYRDYRNTHFSVEKKTFNVKPSMSQVMKDIYKDYPDLEGVFRYGIGVEVNKEVPLVGERRDLRIEKAWLAPGGLYLIYSVNLLKGDKTLDDIPELDVGNIAFHRDNGPDFTLSFLKGNTGTRPQKVKDTYNRRVYQYFVQPYDYQSAAKFTDEKTFNHFESHYLEHVKSVTLKNVKAVKKKKKTKVEDIPFSASFNMDKYLIKTVPVNRKIQLGDEISVNIKDYQQFFNHGVLNYEAENGRMGSIISIVANVHFKGGSTLINWNEDNSIPKTFSLVDGQQFFPNIGASSVTITPLRYEYTDSTPIHFRISKSKMKSLADQPGKEFKVADIKNGGIYISIGSNNQNNNGLQIIFKYDNTKYPHVGNMNWMTSAEFNNLSKEDQDAVSKNNQIIDIKDSEGHPLTTFTASGMMNEGDDVKGYDGYQFYAGFVNWFDFSGLDITLQSVVYTNKITTEPITIPLEK
ncbi:MAG: hypothetical protein ACO1OC_08300 [Tuberibacillus sp.]